MGEILLSLSETRDLLMLVLDLLRGLTLRLAARFIVLAFYLDRDSE
jgi:hypothetical protein